MDVINAEQVRIAYSRRDVVLMVKSIRLALLRKPEHVR